MIWWPDGSHIAFSLTPDAVDFDRYQVWVMRSDGSEARCASPAEGHGYFAPVWIGNNRVGALSPRASKYDVIVIDIPTSAGRRIGSIDTADCDWSPARRWIVYAKQADTTPNP